MGKEESKKRARTCRLNSTQIFVRKISTCAVLRVILAALQIRQLQLSGIVDDTGYLRSTSTNLGGHEVVSPRLGVRPPTRDQISMDTRLEITVALLAKKLPKYHNNK